MHSRKDQDKPLIKLPNDWLTELGELLNTTYKDFCDKKNKSFLVLGHTYPDEVVLIVSFLDEKSLGSIPITLILSADLNGKNKSDELLEVLVEFIGIFFDQAFSVEEWDDYNSNWEMDEIKGIKFYFTVSRENILLTIKANEILGD
jgi:hypothetical protein